MPATGNYLLDALPPAEQNRISSSLERVHLGLGEVLFEPDQRLPSAYFPIDGVISTVMLLDTGSTIEVGLVGREGVVGAWLAMGGVDFAPWRGIVENEGDAWRMSAGDYSRHLDALPTFRRYVLRYGLAQSFLSSQSIACNRFHELTERTARWLLILHTKTETDELHLTQEFLAEMLGVHRPSVTLALQALGAARLVEQPARARIRILDADGLRSVACECFGRMVDFNERVLGEMLTRGRSPD